MKLLIIKRILFVLSLFLTVSACESPMQARDVATFAGKQEVIEGYRAFIGKRGIKLGKVLGIRLAVGDAEAKRISSVVPSYVIDGQVLNGRYKPKLDKDFTVIKLDPERSTIGVFTYDADAAGEARQVEILMPSGAGGFAVAQVPVAMRGDVAPTTMHFSDPQLL